MSHAVYEGTVAHRRFLPKVHSLSYHIFQVLLDLDRLDELKSLKLFSHNSFNLFGFYDRDHGPDQAASQLAPLKDRMQAMLRGHGLHEDGDRILLMAMPRVLGFVFNPISLYFLQDKDGIAKAVVYEVNNTFGDRHSYVLPVLSAETGKSGRIRQTSDKRLHVSPFMDMDMAYDFDLTAPSEKFALNIDLHKKVDQGLQRYLFAGFAATRKPLNDRELLRLFFVMPFMTLKVVLGIHWEALLLAFKGMKLKPKPPTERSSVSV